MVVNFKPPVRRDVGSGTSKLPAFTRLHRDWRYIIRTRQFRIGLSAFLIFCTLCLAVFGYFYIKYERIVDRRMRGQIFSTAAKIYANPAQLRVGDPFDARELIASLRRAGYDEEGEGGSTIGTYKLVRHGLQIKPGPESYHSPEEATITGKDGKVSKITSDGQELGGYELEPELVTGLFEGQQRSKRRLIRYEDIPRVMVDAVLAIEDRRFFHHSGVNYFRLAEAAWINFRQRRYEQGGSTLTMQIARGFFLTPEKTTKRKLTEILISSILEQRFTKKQIFELYANQVYMGQRGSFTVTGFGEASQAYFGKDIKNLTIPEAALLAGIIQRPNYYSPYKYPDRAVDRRNLVLDAMVETNAITRDGAERAKATPIKLAAPNVEAREAPYFVDLVKDTLLTRYSESEINENSYRIYSTIDPALQAAAAEAIEIGMKEVDAQITKLRTKTIVVGKGKKAKKETVVQPGPDAQVALVAMDPRTGEVVALVGGRNYGLSQLNHAMARRPTGSIFKPFVYAAAINTAVAGGDNVLTPTSMVDDSPTTFTYGDQIYEPRNYREEYHGPVTMRYSLALSLNNATVKIAEQTGYDKVAELARAAGIRSVQATPAMALGAYDATPLDMASAYTAFVNAGVKVSPVLVKSLRDAKGNVIENFTTNKQQVMDARVAYVMTNMMEGVLNFGTAYGVRTRGFTAPAAGKTGTSHDAWFAGYTNNLVCIVWVGYDDYSDLRLSGAYTAAPIWAEFMKRAVAMPAYEEAKSFAPPEGITSVTLDKATNRLSTPNCPDEYSAAFIAGTEPKENCESGSLLSKIFGALMPKPAPPVSNPQAQQPQPGQPPPAPGQPAAAATQAPPTLEPQKKEDKKRGFWGKLFGGGDEEQEEKEKKEDNKSESSQPAGSNQNPAPR